MENKGEAEYFELAIPIDKILQMMGMCRAKFDKQWRKEMMECGAIFKVRKGNPRREYIMAFPSRIKAFVGHVAARGDTL